IAINNQSGVFTRTVNYSGETGYIFRIVSFDKFGNRSVSSEVTATLLRNRDISTARAMDDGSLIIQWGNNVQYIDHCKLSYTDKNGITVSHKTLPSEATTTLSNYPESLSYTTLFVLIPSTTDTFRVETVAPEVVESTTFNGPHILSSSAPCEIQARDFDYGGEGLAFHEVSNRTPNSSYRTAAGDNLSKTVDIEGGGNLGCIGVGEWLVYTIEVQDAGVYAVDVNMSANNTAGGSFYFSVDGNRSETTVTPNQGSWSAWIWVFENHPDFTQPTFRLSAGKHKLRFTVGPGAFNLMKYKFTYIGE
ncbi:MAG: carbohydrate-binding protein, partial [Tannerella sp.]|nr:carbohydrate-binding protein [Tannerella sp.]